jgi:hypothetical protein
MGAILGPHHPSDGLRPRCGALQPVLCLKGWPRLAIAMRGRRTLIRRVRHLIAAAAIIVFTPPLAIALSGAALAAAFDISVACVQSKLVALGYYSAAIDGLAGPRTQDALAKAAAKFALRAARLDAGPLVSLLCEDLADIEAKGSSDPMLRYVTDLAPSDATLKLILDGVRAQRRYLDETGKMAAAVYVFRNMDALVVESRTTADKWAGSAAMTSSSNMYFKYSEASRLAAFALRKAAASEAFHVHQYALMGRRVDGPAWLIEGSANYVGYLAQGDDGLRQWAERRSAIGQIGLARLTNAAQYQETPLNAVYDDASTAAVELLVQKTSLEKVKTEYWAARAASSESWEQTFQRVFGISADEFLRTIAANTAPAYRPEGTRLMFAADVSAADQAAFQRYMADVDAFMNKNFAFAKAATRLSDPVTVNVFAHAEDRRTAYYDYQYVLPSARDPAAYPPTMTAFATGHTVWWTMDGPCFTDPRNGNSPGCSLAKILAHESFHVVQNDIGLRPPRAPSWVHEGLAEYIGVAFAIDAGLLSPSRNREYLLAAVGRSTTPLTGLDQLSMTTPGIYQTLAVVFIYLNGNNFQPSPGDIATVVAFYKNLAAAPDWKVAFERTWGRPFAVLDRDVMSYLQSLR